jgi:hypothetical protein
MKYCKEKTPIYHSMFDLTKNLVDSESQDGSQTSDKSNASNANSQVVSCTFDCWSRNS